MNQHKFFVSILACVFVLGCAAKAPITPSREATITDSINPAEVMVETAGVGYNTDSESKFVGRISKFDEETSKCEFRPTKVTYDQEVS